MTYHMIMCIYNWLCVINICNSIIFVNNNKILHISLVEILKKYKFFEPFWENFVKIKINIWKMHIKIYIRKI